MMKEQVMVTKISVKRQGERKHFQIKLPKNTKFLIGIECGWRLIDKPDAISFKSQLIIGDHSQNLFQRSPLIGELKLQSCEESNWFYSGEVLGAEANLSYGDFSDKGFNVNDCTHGNKRTEEIVKVDAESTIIQGWYLDVLGKSQNADINYEVRVYVWINVEE